MARVCGGLALIGLGSGGAWAAAYSIPADLNAPATASTLPCVGANAYWSGTKCIGTITLAAGDTVTSTSGNVTLSAGGVNFAGNNTIGAPGATVTIVVDNQPATVSLGANITLYGGLSNSVGSLSIGGGAKITGNLASSGALTIGSGATITGNVAATNGLLSIDASTINGNITADNQNGAIALTGGSMINGSVGNENPRATSLTVTGGKITGDVLVENFITATQGVVFGNGCGMGGGNLKARTGNISFDGGAVTGNVLAEGNNVSITAVNTTFCGKVEASGSPAGITLTGGSVAGGIANYNNTGNNIIKTTGTDVSGGVTGGTFIIDGGVISGPMVITSSCNPPVSSCISQIKNATMTSGSITGGGPFAAIEIIHSTLGSPTSQVNISVTNNKPLVAHIRDGSVVYGNVQTNGFGQPSPGSIGWTAGDLVKGGSTVVGECRALDPATDQNNPLFKHQPASLRQRQWLRQAAAGQCHPRYLQCF
ncbi:MAG: polymer-forming cytoskeletal protein [Azonexus sp.]|jgi:hypothetical protein|nr:polymer-forming cytoskeletal protein [Azonexus sp.]